MWLPLLVLSSPVHPSEVFVCRGNVEYFTAFVYPGLFWAPSPDGISRCTPLLSVLFLHPPFLSQPAP